MSTPDRMGAPDELAFASLLSGAFASGAIALMFLVMDTIKGDPLSTPSLMGSVVLLGQAPAEVAATRMDMVALYSLVHFGAFALLGTAASMTYARFTAVRRSRLALTGLLFGLLTVGSAVAEALIGPGLLESIGPLSLVSANAVASGVMAWVIGRTLSDAPVVPSPLAPSIARLRRHSR